MAITLNTKVYNFSGFDQNGVSVFQEVSGGVATAFSYLTCRVQPGNSGKDSTVRWRLTMPIVAATDSECGCAGTVVRTFRYEDGRSVIPATATLAERTDFQVRVKDLAACAQFIASYKDLVQPTA